MHFDVVVLGGGVAGTAAAIAARQLGAQTCVLAGAPGASALFAGAWRGGCPDGLRRALADVGYELSACTRPLPHAHGHLIDCDAAPPSHEAAHLINDAVVIGIAGLPGFDASMLALQWSARADVQLRSDTLTLDHTPAAGWAPLSLAGQIERALETMVDPLRRALRKHAATRVVLPAVLGVGYDNAIRSRLGDELDVVISEALAVPPSLPGWRLHSALRMALRRSDVTVLEGKGLASARHDGRVQEIELLNGDVVTGHTFVLATGKYAAGGIEVDARFREPALGCPVWVEHLGERFESVDSLMLTDPDRAEDQPLLRAGVHTDAEHRPVNASNDVVYSNVLVAGSVRADWSLMTHGIGAAAHDGWAAGVKAAGA
jgi:glycerol-3-phosphate dehydrogenase subunit B